MDIKTLHTKQLLKMLRQVQREQGSINLDWWYSKEEHQEDLHNYEILKSKEADIKKELATREHVPNKIEARKIRQEKARRK